jgi:hypothetical protein
LLLSTPPDYAWTLQPLCQTLLTYFPAPSCIPSR